MINNDFAFFTCFRFMTTKLKLKSNELNTYAIIYGFSQDGESVFNGSASYIAKNLNISRRAVFDVLKKLVDRGLIIKIEKNMNGVTVNNYKINIQPLVDCGVFSSEKSSGVVKKVQGGGEESSQGGGEESSPNNIYMDNINNNIFKRKEYKEKKRPTLDEVKEYAISKNMDFDFAKNFYEYFETGEWVDSHGNKVKNWKQKMLTWIQFKSKKEKKEENNENIIELREDKLKRVCKKYGWKFNE